MLSTCCRQFLRQCRQIHGMPRFGSKVSSTFETSRKLFLTSAFSSSSTGGSDKPMVGAGATELGADKGADDKIAAISDMESEDGDFPAPVEGETEEEALEARRRYYAMKVSGDTGPDLDEEDLTYVPLREQKIDELGRSYGTGKRKTSIARVWIKDGSGVFVINDRKLVDYFPPISREACLGAFVASQTSGLFDVWCTVKGGGVTGQSGAIRLGIARALEAYNPNYRQLLAPAGMLTRDNRRVERKKPGQKKARKQFQWVKR